MPLDPDLAGLLALIAGGPQMADGTPDEARAGFRALTLGARDPAAVPQVAAVEEISVPGGDGPRPARIYRPEATGALPTVVFFHGGGFVIGDLDTHDVLARTLATACDAVVVSVDYRLAPEHPWPAGVEDAIAAARWAADSLDSLGGTPVLALAGDSAGGNLAAIAAQTLRDDRVPLAAQLLIYPVTDMATHHPSLAENATGYFLSVDTMAWFDQQYVGHLAPAELDKTDPRLSPRHGRLDGLPPAVVVVAEFDPLRDDGLAYAAALAEAGVPVQVRTYAGLIHGFFDMGAVSAAARSAVAETLSLFRPLLHP